VAPSGGSQSGVAALLAYLVNDDVATGTGEATARGWKALGMGKEFTKGGRAIYIGGLYDLKYMFIRLRSLQRDEHDDGTVRLERT
jgi:hypothetical protein